MATFVDDQISPLPIQVTDLKVDRSKLKLQRLRLVQYGRLPGRTSQREGAIGSFMAFTYIARGRGTLQVNDGPVETLEAGSLFWEWPGEHYRFGPAPGEDWDEYYVIFEGERTREWFEGGIVSLEEPILRVGLDPLWIGRLEAIGAYMESGIASHCDRAALLLESLVYDFSQAHASFKAADRFTQKQDLIQQVLEDIASSLYGPWDEQAIWERNHISRSTLRRIVLHNTGYPLNDYVHRLKLSEAKKLLLHTGLQVKEIADRLGYNDVAYFSRLFHKHTQTSAQAFRKQSRL